MIADSIASGSGHDDSIRPLTRGVSLAIIPFLVVAYAVLYPFPHHTGRHDVPGTISDLLLPVRVSRVIAVLGALSALTALFLFLFLFPGRAVAVWPWKLTPLTARVLGAIFALGIAGLGALAERRWSSARILFQVAALMLTLILVAGARASGELDPSNAMTWLIGVGFAGVLAAIAVLYLRMRPRHSRLATQG